MSGETFTSNNTGTRIFDTTGQYQFNPDACSLAATYNADGTVATVTLTDPITSLSFRQTFTWTTGSLTGVTGWVKQ
ncbi:MAG TPA: hypothetical protein VFM46_09715 [Pseudomonadales bacterium]|nr:hypothetical protein [Pseudomonadales bacterium]